MRWSTRGFGTTAQVQRPERCVSVSLSSGGKAYPGRLASQNDAASGPQNNFVLRCNSGVALSSVAFASGHVSPRDVLSGAFKRLRQAASSSLVQRLRMRLADRPI